MRDEQYRAGIIVVTVSIAFGLVVTLVLHPSAPADAEALNVYQPAGQADGGTYQMVVTSYPTMVAEGVKLPAAQWPQDKASYPMLVGLADAPVILSAPPATAIPPPSDTAIPEPQPTASQSQTPPNSALPPPPSPGQAQRKATPGNYNLLGKPSISVTTIEQVLKQYNSPAEGEGQTFYDLGVKYGVDPAYMLAFYVHESAAGTAGAAVATRSVGNIICAGWGGNCIGRFRAYDSYAQAAEDWYQLITGPLYIGAGLITPDAITPRYAPSSDNNDPNGYAKTVERLVDQWRAAQPLVLDFGL